MSDSKDSTVTYTAVSSPFADLPDIGSPGVDGPPVMPEDPYAYVVAAFQAPPSPDYVSGPEYPPSPDILEFRISRDLQMGNILILRVYYVEGLGHNLFFIGKFCDSDLEVAFRKHTCFVRNLEGVDLLSGSRGSNLYTISIADMMKSSLVCLLSKASKTKSWLLHRRLSHLNFGTINQLAKQGLVKGFPKLKYTKDHLCSASQMGKSKKESHPHKDPPTRPLPP
ncbi:retrovirus-related pol polyprotein from transposon TNT 1-94 [Tanacetum coccineum]